MISDGYQDLEGSLAGLSGRKSVRWWSAKNWKTQPRTKTSL
ncbi:MAG: hypothetical protein ACLSG5_02180 [Oscillospiraceae bacterium]